MSSHLINLASMAKLNWENGKGSPDVFDRLILHVYLPINVKTKREFLVEYKIIGGLPPDCYKNRTTIRSIGHPFTFIERELFIRIELNPNRYQSFYNVYHLLDSFFLNFSPEKAIVKELHVNVDTPIPILSVYESLTFKKRSKVEEYNAPVHREFTAGKGVTINYGHRSNRLCVYDKARQLKIKGVTLTRFERRYNRNHCPIKTLADVNRLLEIKPFEDVEFNALSAFTPTTLQDEIQWRGTRQLIQEDGMHNAIRKLSRTGHFKRDWAIFIEKKIPPDLQSMYLKNMRKFLMVNKFPLQEMNR